MVEEAIGNSNSMPPADDVDLYCLQCGYNLRGHTGDPRRCPECGSLNPVGDLVVPAPLIKIQLRRMETTPTICVGAFIVFVISSSPWLSFIILRSSMGSQPIRSEALVCCGLPWLASLAVLIWSTMRFRAACLAKSGWLYFLFMYHVYMIGLILLLVIPIGFGVACFKLDYYTHNLHDYIGIFYCTVVIWSILIIITLGRWVRRRLKERMDILQREVAVRMARDRQRREIQRSLVNEELEKQSREDMHHGEQ